MAAMDDLDLSCAAWRKSTHSNNGGECVEITCAPPNTVAIRDSKDPDGPKMTFIPQAWNAFTAAVQALRTEP